MLLLMSAGCAPTGNTLDWWENSYCKVQPNSARTAGTSGLAFATTVDAQGRAAEGVLQSRSIQIRGQTHQGTVSLHNQTGFVASVWLMGFEPKDLSVQAKDFVLTDNRGHRFTVQPVTPSYGCAAEFRVDPAQNANWMEFNNRSYWLSLEIGFTYAGQPMKISWPRIYCVLAPSAE